MAHRGEADCDDLPARAGKAIVRARDRGQIHSMNPRPLRALLTASLLFAVAGPSAGPGTAGAAVIGKDDRRTFVEYSQHYDIPLIALRRRFGASGLLDCPGRLASAQVVGNRWTIVTNAHNLLDDGGTFPWALDTCVFIVTGLDGRTTDHRISVRAWRLGTQFPARNRYRDWAVLSLEAPVPAWVEPYLVDNPSAHPVPRRASIVVVAASHDNWRGRSKRVASVQRCRLRGIRVRINGHRNLLGFDCDTGKGASGAALLVKTRLGYRLIGIGVGERNLRPGAPYDGTRHFNAAVPLHRAVYRAIQSVVAEQRRDTSTGRLWYNPEFR